MTAKRKVEVFSAGCPACTDVETLVKSLACSSCEVDVLDMRDLAVAQRAKALGVRSVPAVAIDGRLAGCCAEAASVAAARAATATSGVWAARIVILASAARASPGQG